MTDHEQLPIGGLEALAKLREPFQPNQISKLPKPTSQQTDEVKRDYTKGIRCELCSTWHHPRVVHLDYIGHAALTDRLLDVDPLWSWEPLAMNERGLPLLDEDGGMWIKLTVCGMTRLGYGDAQNKLGPNATKERIGDALRNAAMRFGAGLDMWHKGILHMDSDIDDEAPTAEQKEQKAPDPRPARELCSAEKFATNEKAWRAVIDGGKKTPDALIAFLGTKLDFTDAQKTTIRGWTAQQDKDTAK